MTVLPVNFEVSLAARDFLYSIGVFLSMVWWSRKKRTTIEETRDLAEKIDTIQDLKDISTLISALHDILMAMNKRLNELERIIEEQEKRLEEVR
jgi:CO dehydrogenase/acetyl-CoA synthase beta subunit